MPSKKSESFLCIPSFLFSAVHESQHNSSMWCSLFPIAVIYAQVYAASVNRKAFENPFVIYNMRFVKSDFTTTHFCPPKHKKCFFPEQSTKKYYASSHGLYLTLILSIWVTVAFPIIQRNVNIFILFIMSSCKINIAKRKMSHIQLFPASHEALHELWQ